MASSLGRLPDLASRRRPARVRALRHQAPCPPAAAVPPAAARALPAPRGPSPPPSDRSEEHTSELQSLMRISYAVFCLKKKKTNTNTTTKYATKQTYQLRSRTSNKSNTYTYIKA